MTFKFDVKKLNILYLVIFALALISVILYGINISVEGFYKGVTVDGLVGLSILDLALILIIILAGFIKADGVVGKIIDVVVLACKAVVPCLLVLLAVKLVGGRVDGYGYIFFSNADVAKEVGTVANISSAVVSIVDVAIYLVTGVVAIVASFIKPKED